MKLGTKIIGDFGAMLPLWEGEIVTIDRTYGEVDIKINWDEPITDEIDNKMDRFKSNWQVGLMPFEKSELGEGESPFISRDTRDEITKEIQASLGNDFNPSDEFKKEWVQQQGQTKNRKKSNEEREPFAGRPRGGPHLQNDYWDKSDDELDYIGKDAHAANGSSIGYYTEEAYYE